MSDNLEGTIKEVCRAAGKDRTRLMDVVRVVQEKLGCVSGRAMDLIAREMGVHRVEVQSVVSFYAFLSEEPKGRIVIRLCNDIVDQMYGMDRVARAFEEELGISVGQTTPDGKITLEYTPCIGMCDQAPAALVNDVVVPELSSDRAREVARELKSHLDPRRLIRRLGDGNNAHALINAMVVNNLRLPGPIVFSAVNRGEALRKALSMTPAEVIRVVKTSRLRGRGGAGFPTGMKWEFARGAPGTKRCVICNADEGEPGTFKDRVLLTERPDRVFAGMTIAGYAIGADEGILYLRAEYAYLRRFLEDVLQKRREENLLGRRVCGKADFDFDIRIQMGAGAYVCGEETALISSCEGWRGDPKNRPPFPAQKGYLDRPTVVNNVETLCCVTKILEEGAAAFSEHGSSGSTGTKLLSISGDCTRPGVYEVEFGIKLGEVLKLAGADDPIAVQVGGPSGQLVSPAEFNRTICYDDLATGGAIVVFGAGRDLLHVVESYLDFFIEESCGYCTPCRVGNVLLKERVARIRAGQGQPKDLEYLQDLGQTIKIMSRCGLGQTSANPVLTTLKNFRSAYERLVKETPDGLQPAFDLAAAVRDAERVTGRASAHVHG
ncbi:MAG: NAD(P)H-dependent oxidoreductase subunit E [Planctomycetota bacterium]